MKVYIASSFSLQNRINRVLNQLRFLDIEYTVDWWNRRTLKEKFAELSREEFYSQADCAYAFKTDIQGVKDADILLFVADEIPKRYNGACVELGIALAFNKPVLCWGRLENSFLFYSVKQVDSLKEFVEILYMLKEKYDEVEG